MVVQEIRKLTGTDMASRESRQQEDYISFRDIWAFLRRHFLILALASAAGLALGALYIAKTQPTYTSIARIVIDREQARIASQDASTGTIIIETAEIASEVEIVKSEAIARSVIKQLNLTEDPEIQTSSSWRSAVRGAISALLSVFDQGDEGAAAAGEPDEEDIMRRTMAGFLGRVSVRRVGQSYVLEIGYTSTNPDKAARAANAIANTYMQSSLDAKSQIIARGAQWIEDRLVEVGQQAHEAALSAEEYRNRNDIAQVGASGLDQQQLTEISSQLLSAQAAKAGEAARLATINRMLAGELPDSYVGEALNNTEINRLRSELGAARTRLEAQQTRYGAESEPTLAAKAEIARLEGLITTELVRIQGVYKSNLDTAEAREQLLQKQLDAIKGNVSEKNLARVELTELESRATTYRRMYESVLQQLISTLQKQSFPIGDARMVTAATPPLAKNWPKTTLIMPMALMLGFAGGLGLAGLRDVLDRRISSGERLGRELGLPTLGYVPFTRFQAPGSKGALRFVLDAPYSGFSEALRGVKSSIDAAFPAGGPIVVGLTSVGGGEGKSTIAANLGQLYANEGLRVVLVDANFKKPYLSIQAASAGPKAGLAIFSDDLELDEPVDGKRKGDKQVRHDEAPILPVLTVDHIRKAAHPGHRFGHLPALKKKLEELRHDYDVIIVDLSTFATSADARAASAYVDGILLVLGNRRNMTVEWLANALSTFGKSRVGILGVVFNKRKSGQWWRPSSRNTVGTGEHHGV
ncbi:lipopolysaccharide biosynthesis protein [Nitratireductor aquimarinus]|uniref:GumC family protein n=1 Tax=Nitratireductor TaxID=245876 RepID=UPI0019D39865|nr:MULTISPECIES: Wzz/FepE/Etk N-terminal domain-containing protein [Nitratireductor]MBN7777486.1 lipopolysaccharide biosynthesis protein [Nitratireductor pacificus]MBN7781479.1 lipopolysaccharide biosynthesis protein [Nitratireductor pacificus]MBN7790285.1 lipopolysaccharide biosynthesis protein [Nitratireductor aquimarinus]MBY6099695.1 lipopolysaccharide biosynthesis protein [Nitratireductor aquimarinus]MCA1261171.1 lipopolysaccharide biosynthesis protein [Nitratireductor aquimarinus]